MLARDDGREESIREGMNEGRERNMANWYGIGSTGTFKQAGRDRKKIRGRGGGEKGLKEKVKEEK